VTKRLPIYEKVFRWYKVFLIIAFLAPPIPLGFTQTNSTVSFAVFIAALYLVWRVFYFKDTIPNPFTPFGVCVYLMSIFLVLHSLFFLFNGLKIVFLMEMQWLIYFLFSAVIIFDMRDIPNAIPRITKLTLLVLFIEGILGIVSSFTGPFYDYMVGFYGGRYGLSIYRAVGTMGSANIFGGITAFALLFAIFSPKEYIPFKKWIMVPILTVALLFSQSKSAIGAFSLGVGAIIVFQLLYYKSFKKIIKLYSYVAVVLFVLYRVKVIISEVSTDLSTRVLATENVLQKFLDNSIMYKIFGMGFRQSATINSVNNAWNTAHNSYVSFLTEIGILGMSILVLLWLTCIYYLFKGKHWGMLGGLIAFLAHFYSEGFLYGYQYVCLMNVVFAVGYVSKLRRIGKDVSWQQKNINPQTILIQQ
jgi:hypothetical protein